MTSRRLFSVGVVVAALVVGTTTGYGTSQAAPPAGDNPAVLPADRTYTVTLLTGDVVTVHTRKSGCPGVEVRPAKPDGAHTTSCGPDGHVTVIPNSALPLVGRVLDDDLFDVTTLIQEGYDDASSADLPLIVRGGQTRALAGQRALPSIGAVAGRQPKFGVAGFVHALAQARTADGPRVWLDRRVQATGDSATGENTVDANLRQVKAPQAWAAGHTGTGVRVAVLDTGVDPTHPDLAGKVVARADFTVDGGDAVDRLGHGTHVAATVAGSGTRRGVAPDAQLVVGKVLDDQGFGSESQVIAGMEWAAPLAKVVNMSLGGPGDGTDPLAMAVEQLTQQHGTLFVTSAGNDGPVQSTVGTPAVAPSALAVGAVDSRDRIAEFSSRGPVAGSRALKPEITAPGVDIVAARAAGTSLGEPVDARYTRMSGTSMAAPHVAGAAAILAQRHPDWDGPKLKAALVGAADPARGGDPYEVGAGRLNVAKAAGDVVSGTGLVNLGTFAYPQTGTAETKIGWTNTGDRAVRLALDVRVTDRYGKTAAHPAVTLAAKTVTVPANADASAVLRLDRDKLGAGLYTAVVTARWAGGSSTTPVAFYVEPPSHDLTVTATPPPGTPADSVFWTYFAVVNVADPALHLSEHLIEPGGVTTVRVPAGRYSVMGVVDESGPSPEDPESTETRRLTMTGDPDVTVSSDLAVDLDTSAAKQVTATVDGLDTSSPYTSVAFQQHPRRGLWWSLMQYVWGEPAREGKLHVTPTEKVGIGAFEGYEGFVLDTEDRATRYDLIRTVPGRLPADPAYRVTAAEHARLARIDQRFLTVDVPGASTSHRRVGETESGLYLVDADHSRDFGPTRVDYVSPNGVWTDIAGTGDVFFTAFVEPRQRYAAGSRQEKVWARQPLRPDWFGDGTSISVCKPDPIRRTGTRLRVTLVEYTDQHDRFTCMDDTWPEEWVMNTKRQLALYRNGTLVGSYAGSRTDFPMSREKADYRLTYDLDASAIFPVSTRVDTAWTFTSAGPSGTSDAPVPLLSVDYALPLDAANHPTTGAAAFTVRQAPGTTPQNVTEFKVWTSVDDGTTWTPVDVREVAGNRFSAQLPGMSAGHAMSLRISVTADGGSGMEQTIIRAFRGGGQNANRD